jgi:hypothetical protein
MARTIKEHVRNVLGEGPLLNLAHKNRPMAVPIGNAMVCKFGKMSTADIEAQVKADKEFEEGGEHDDVRQIRIALMEAELKFREENDGHPSWHGQRNPPKRGAFRDYPDPK